MSADNKASDLQLPAVDQAVGLRDQLFCERFFGKMAEYGHVPQSEKQAEAMLTTAAQLDQLPEPDAGPDPYVDAGEKLAAYLQQQTPPPVAENQRKAAAANERQQLAVALAQDPDLYGSILTIKAAEREAAAQATR